MALTVHTNENPPPDKDKLREMERTLGMLNWIGLERRFKPGWAATQFKARYGAWPNAFPLRPEVSQFRLRPSGEFGIELLDWLDEQYRIYKGLPPAATAAPAPQAKRFTVIEGGAP